ncbi:carboxylate--amine ligase [Halolamina rubra]|uniref:carboxylate--amine ligase n=1 Tax=Halolamina rubra TaxID=1380430 RepID=UPI0009E402A3|nr:ATP-grasp domain-containing protein [Halolamina rubra]
MSSVLVLNAHAKSGLVAIRRLAARGIDVTAASSMRWSAARFSRDVDRYLIYPDPARRTGEFLEAVEGELARGDYDVLLPINEQTVETVVHNRSRFERHTTVPFPSYEQLLVGLDKRRTVEAAREAGSPLPETLFSDEASLADVEATLGYPVVVKYPFGEGGKNVYICESADELERATRRGEERFGVVLFQEFVPNGGERGVYTLYDASTTMVGLTVQRRLRSRPPEGGASTYRETVADPDLVAVADEFLTSLDWSGLAMVEFRIDARTGEPKLIELNPRFWGSLSLSTFAGVDFPYLLYRLAIDESPPPVLEYDVGVRSRCLFTDALQLTERADRLRAVREFLTPSPRPCTHDIVSLRDPLPTVGQVAYYAAVAYEKVTGSPADDVSDREAPTPQRS